MWDLACGRACQSDYSALYCSQPADSVCTQKCHTHCLLQGQPWQDYQVVMPYATSCPRGGTLQRKLRIR